MEIHKPKQGFLILLSTLLFVCNLSAWMIHAQVSIPAKFDGFVFKNRLPQEDTIMIEAFFDPVCPDSRDSWPPLKQALNHYGHRLSLIVHPFPLPYHDNSFITSRALHIVNKLNASATYHLLEKFFKHQESFIGTRFGKGSGGRTSLIEILPGLDASRIWLLSMPVHLLLWAGLSGSEPERGIQTWVKLSLVDVDVKQEKFYNQQTLKMSRASVVDHIVAFVTKVVGNDSSSAVASGFNNRNSDLATRVSFKYGCSRGVAGTPTFFVNGFPLPNADSDLDYNGWRKIIDPLISVQYQSG